ncbi:MAG: holo-ACP synthase [Candidatus Krumholzibacteriia bacterium]
MVGIGVDIVAVERVAALLARHGDRFEQRCFRPAECTLARGRPTGRAAALAARWAAKEAFLKALGRPTAGVHPRDIEVVRDEAGRPSLRLHATAAAALAAAGGTRAHVSLSHERTHAVAVVLVE